MLKINEDDLIGNNLILTAAKHYVNMKKHGYEEFLDDLKIVGRIQSIISRRSNQIENNRTENNKINRLLVNHIIIFFNVFNIQFAKTYLFFYVKPVHHPILKTILIFLSFMDTDEMIEIPLDQGMIKFLREQI